MQVAMLGPLEVRTDDDSGIVLDVGGSRLRALQALLVLDNCEHLIEATAALADRILAACPQVRILVTSRDPLNIAGEALWTVGSLTLPPAPAVSFDFPERAGVLAPKPPQAPSGIDDHASVRLLTQRARAVFPDFSLTGDAVDLPRGPAAEPDSESLAVVYALGAGDRSVPGDLDVRRPRGGLRRARPSAAGHRTSQAARTHGPGRARPAITPGA